MQMSPKSAAPIMDLACLQRPPLPEAAQQAPLPRRSQGRTLAAHQALARILNKQGPSTARQPTPSECAPSSSEAVLSGYCSPCQLDGSCSSGEPSTTNIGSSTSTASSSPADACIEANSSSCAYTSPRLPSGEMHSGSHRSRRPSGGSGGNSRSSSRHPSGEHSGICKQLHACADVALESAIQGLLSPSSSRRSSIEHGNPTKRLHASELDAASPRSSMPASEAGGCCASAGAAAPPAVAWHELSGCVVSLIAAHAGDSLRPLMPMLSTCRWVLGRRPVSGRGAAPDSCSHEGWLAVGGLPHAQAALHAGAALPLTWHPHPLHPNPLLPAHPCRVQVVAVCAA